MVDLGQKIDVAPSHVSADNKTLPLFPVAKEAGQKLANVESSLR
jgi:hypothetical protein